jgi:hypothetical protein
VAPLILLVDPVVAFWIEGRTAYLVMTRTPAHNFALFHARF